MSLIAIEPFDAKYIIHQEDNSRTWHPCRVIGTQGYPSGHSLVVLVHDDDGKIRVSEVSEVFSEDAAMPSS